MRKRKSVPILSQPPRSKGATRETAGPTKQGGSGLSGGRGAVTSLLGAHLEATVGPALSARACGSEPAPPRAECCAPCPRLGPGRDEGTERTMDSQVLLFLAKWKTKTLLRIWEALGPGCPHGLSGPGTRPGRSAWGSGRGPLASIVPALLADLRRARWGLALRRSRPAQRGASSLPPQPRACLFCFLGLRFLIATRLWNRV